MEHIDHRYGLNKIIFKINLQKKKTFTTYMDLNHRDFVVELKIQNKMKYTFFYEDEEKKGSDSYLLLLLL